MGEKQLNCKIRRAKRNKENQLAKNSCRNPNQFYNYIKKATKQQSTVGPLINEGLTITSNVDMANILNSFFVSVFTKENEADIHF